MKHPNPWQDNQKLIKVNNTRWSINFRTYIWSLDKGLKSWEKVRGWRLNIITKFNNWEIKRKAINIDRLTWFLNWLARDCTHQDPSSVQFSSATLSCLTLRPHGLQHARLSCLSPTPRACSNSGPLSWQCHPTSVIPFSSCLQSYPESGSFPVNNFFTPDGQSIGVSASASVLPMNTQDLSPLGWTGWISLMSKGLSRVFTNTRVQKHQSFSTQSSLWSNSHNHTRLLEKP